MRWRKLGKIFDPTMFKLSNNCVEFAQSPQTLILPDRVRIYFSTRERDKTGKYLSHVAFVEFDKTLQSILNVSDRTVMPLGSLGCFDEHGIFPINILRDGKRILAYTTGWNRKVSVSNDASIGLAESHDDGLTFVKVGDGPVLTSSLHEPFLVADAFVRIFNGTYHMWYIYGSKWIVDPSEKDPQRIYKIVHAKSPDGISWEREGRHLIQDHLNENECQALPTVISFDRKYHMFFCYREAIGFRGKKDRGYRIGYAFSTDLINWTRDDKNAGLEFSDEGWDSEMLCYPHVFEYEKRIYMLYNGNEFGRYGFGAAVLEN